MHPTVRTAVGAVLFTLALAFVACGGEEGGEQPSLDAFVRGTYVHGVPYAKAHAFGSEAVPQLLDWLEDPGREDHWANIVTTAGMIGPTSSDQVDHMIAFLEREHPGGPLSHAVYQAKQATVMALGYAAHHMDDPKALDYLVGASEPTQWEADQTPWETPFGEPEAVVQRHFARLGILALGLSGKPAAKARLQDLQDPVGADNPIDNQFRADNQDIVQQALATHQQVAVGGLLGYYTK